MISSGAAAATLPSAADDALSKDQYVVYKSWIWKPSSIIVVQAESWTHNKSGKG